MYPLSCTLLQILPEFNFLYPAFCIELKYFVINAFHLEILIFPVKLKKKTYFTCTSSRVRYIHDMEIISRTIFIHLCGR